MSPTETNMPYKEPKRRPTKKTATKKAVAKPCAECKEKDESIKTLSEQLTSMMVPTQDGEQTVLVPKHTLLEVELADARRRMHELTAQLVVAGQKAQNAMAQLKAAQEAGDAQ